MKIKRKFALQLKPLIKDLFVVGLKQIVVANTAVRPEFTADTSWKVNAKERNATVSFLVANLHLCYV